MVGNVRGGGGVEAAQRVGCGWRNIYRGERLLGLCCCPSSGDERCERLERLSRKEINDCRQRRVSETHLGFLEERVLKELGGAGSLVGVDFETLFEEIAEDDRELLGVIDRWRAVRRDEVEGLRGPSASEQGWGEGGTHAKRVLVEVRRLAFDHFCESQVSVAAASQEERGRRTDGHNTETPDVDLGAVLLARHDFWRHPVRRTDHRRPLRVLALDLSAEPKVGCE